MGEKMNSEIKEVFKNTIFSNKKVRIKLLGDSITHGEGGSGFNQDGEHIIGDYFRNKAGYCWANLFKKHMETQYNCIVENNACTGTKIEFIIDNFETLVSDDDDIVFCAIGTNNRHQCFCDGEKRNKDDYMSEFYNNILTLNTMFKESNKTVVFIANIPASNKNEQDGNDYWRIFHMNDVCDLYKKASEEAGFNFINLYEAFNKYCTDHGISVDSLLADGLHPNDKGHTIIFDLIRHTGVEPRMP